MMIKDFIGCSIIALLLIGNIAAITTLLKMVIGTCVHIVRGEAY